MHPIEVFIKGLLDFLRGSKDKAIKVNDIEAYRDAINKIDSPELRNSEIIKDFKDSTITVNKTEGNTYNIYIIDKDADEIVDKLVERLKSEKDKENVPKVNVFPAEEKINYLGFKDDEKELDKKYTSLYAQLNDRHKALLALAIDITKHYSEKQADIADATKRSTAEKYGDYGLKFCNLWTQGYLKNIFSMLAEGLANSNEPDKIHIDTTITGFINEADSIEFAHKYSDVVKTAIKVNNSLTLKKDYVAVHGLGSAAEKAKKVVEKVKEAGSEYKIVTKDGKRRFSKIWYKGEHGSYIYSLVEKLL